MNLSREIRRTRQKGRIRKSPHVTFTLESMDYTKQRYNLRIITFPNQENKTKTNPLSIYLTRLHTKKKGSATPDTCLFFFSSRL